MESFTNIFLYIILHFEYIQALFISSVFYSNPLYCLLE